MTQEGINFIKKFESFRGEAYLDPVGIPTIGWGTTLISGFKVRMGMQINEPVAEVLLQADLAITEDEVRDLVKVELKPNQYDALISFHYNTGGLAQSTLLRYINAKLPVVERFFTMWNKATVAGKLIELPGLTTRRKLEFALYERP